MPPTLELDDKLVAKSAMVLKQEDEAAELGLRCAAEKGSRRRVVVVAASAGVVASVVVAAAEAPVAVLCSAEASEDCLVAKLLLLLLLTLLLRMLHCAKKEVPLFSRIYRHRRHSTFASRRQTRHRSPSTTVGKSCEEETLRAWMWRRRHRRRRTRVTLTECSDALRG